MRLITFGCSFTDYSWPTWADIIAEDRQCEYENWALGGGGNQQIARRVLYRHSRGFCDRDLVMIQWTSITREDRYIRGYWRTEGSVMTSPTYRGAFLDQHWDWDNDVINTAHSRITTELLLGPRLAYEMEMQWRDSGWLEQGEHTEITDYWRSRIPTRDTVPNTVVEPRLRTSDGHPMPQWWLEWVEQKIYPRWGWQIREETRQRVRELNQQILDLAERLQRGPSRNRQAHLQRRAHELTLSQGWRLNKVKPHSDTLTPGQGTDVIM